MSVHRLHLSPRLLLVTLLSLAWTGFVLWLTIPYLDDIGESTTLPVAIGLIVGLGILPGVLMANEISQLIYEDDELEHRH